jgi:hypothetical protein
LIEALRMRGRYCCANTRAISSLLRKYLGDQFAAAADADLVECGFEMLLDRIVGNGQRRSDPPRSRARSCL